MDSLIRRLAANWKLKLAAFALAVFLWIAVSADQVTTEWIPVPVEVQVTDPGYRVAEGPVPDQVRVQFAGRGRELWELALTERPSVVLLVDEVNGESESLALTPQMVQVPSGLSVAPRDIRPSSVLVEFGLIGSREVPVAVRLDGGPGDGRAIAGTLGVEPGFVRVSGPLELAREVDTLYTLPMDLSLEDSVFRRSVPLDTAGIGELRLSTTEVLVTGRLQTEATRVLSGVHVATPEGTEAAPDTISIQLRGAEGILRDIRPSEVSVSVPPAMVPDLIPFAGIALPMQIDGLPPNVDAATQPEFVRIFPAGQPDTGSATEDDTAVAEPAAEVRLPSATAVPARDGAAPTSPG